MFARISDIKPKTVEELKNLRHLGFDGISIGTESGDDNTLAVMNKGRLMILSSNARSWKKQISDITSCI